MKATSLQTKTIRPGNLNGYSFYYSGRRATGNKAKAKSVKKSHRKLWLGLLILIIIGAAGGVYAQHYSSKPPSTAAPAAQTPATNSATKKSPVVTLPAPVNNCADNDLSQLIKVSISQRHMWACDGTSQVYDSAVITGISYLAADLTPTGTYHIYAKETDQTLTGHDSTGSWNDYVYYWMPFLDNQYGSYGFHDATWRSPSDFGNISPDSANASHGCVEMPLAAAKWLYGWAHIGTTVTIVS